MKSNMVSESIKGRPAAARVLIIEDDLIHRRILQSVFSTDYELDVATYSEQALEKLANNQYDLVIVDLRLPIRVGELATFSESFKILTALQKDHRDGLVVLGVSGHLTNELERQLRQFNIVGRVFEKPFLRSELREYVDMELKKRARLN